MLLRAARIAAQQARPAATRHAFVTTRVVTPAAPFAFHFTGIRALHTLFGGASARPRVLAGQQPSPLAGLFGGAGDPGAVVGIQVRAESVVRKRKKKMNKHKHRKRLKVRRYKTKTGRGNR
jgi:hypothetical protein